MKDIRCDIEKYKEYASDKELLEYYANEISEHTSDYYSFSNLELALYAAFGAGKKIFTKLVG